MFLRPVWTYIVSHWRGEQSLAWSFGVNLVAVRALIFAVQRLLQPAEYHDYHDWRLAVLVLATAFHGILFIWQAIGVFRAGEALIRDHGAIALHWGAQLGVIVAFWLTTSYALNAWQMTIDVPDYVDHEALMNAERASHYQILAGPGGTVLIRGTLELGITRKLRDTLDSDGAIKAVTLSSVGGNIYEARGLAKLFHEKGLRTQVFDECSSACTTAFIGGIERLLKPGARLGFHQYRIEANYTVLGANPKLEEEKDEALYLQAGVSADFVRHMHSAKPEAMWYPETSELIGAGVVTALAE